MDKTTPGTATLNFGIKRWSVDNGPVDCFSVAGMKALSWSEEHTVVVIPKNSRVDVGDYVLVAPRHVCPMVNLFEQMTVIGPNGRIENTDCPIDGRNR
jgi:D-serine deaminase-like pyridoxal phosphate-dependent protein